MKFYLYFEYIHSEIKHYYSCVILLVFILMDFTIVVQKEIFKMTLRGF